MFVSGIWSLLDIRSLARSFSLELSGAKSSIVRSSLRSAPVLAQNLADAQTILDVNQDLRLKEIVVTRNSSDKSLLTVTGMINNRGEKAHYVYYIVAKFVAKDVAIKQAIIPVNIDIEPGKSKPFTHEISTDSSNSIVPANVKPMVVKYEYR